MKDYSSWEFIKIFVNVYDKSFCFFFWEMVTKRVKRVRKFNLKETCVLLVLPKSIG